MATLRGTVRRIVREALQAGERLAVRRTAEARRVQSRADAIALDYARHLDAQLTLATPIMRQAYNADWWARATPHDIGAVWEATASWAAVGEGYAQATLTHLREQTSQRYGVDVRDLRLQPRDVVTLLARARSTASFPAPAPGDRQASYLIRDTVTGTVAAQHLRAEPPPGVSLREHAAGRLVEFAGRLDQQAGEPSDGLTDRFVIEIYPGGDVTAEPALAVTGGLALDVIQKGQADRPPALSGSEPASPEQLLDALQAEEHRLADEYTRHLNALDAATAEALVTHANQAAITREQLDYTRLRIQAAQAEIRGENGTHVFQQASLHARYDTGWWAEATPKEAAVLWRYVAGWSEGAAKAGMVTDLQDHIRERFGATIDPGTDPRQVHAALTATTADRDQPPATTPGQPEPDAPAAPVDPEPSPLTPETPDTAGRPAPAGQDTPEADAAVPPADQGPGGPDRAESATAPGDQPNIPAPESEVSEPATTPADLATAADEPVDLPLGGLEAPQAVPEPVAVDQAPEPSIAESLRVQGAPAAADAVPPLLDAIGSPPGADTLFEDIDRAAAAFDVFYQAVAKDLLVATERSDEENTRRWLSDVEGYLLWSAREYPSFDRYLLNMRNVLMLQTDEAVRRIRERTDVNDEHYPLIVELLERRGYDQDARPLAGSAHGLTDARPFEESLDGARVRINGDDGQIVNGVISRRDSGDWWVDGSTQDGAEAQVRLSNRHGVPPHLELVSPPVDEPAEPGDAGDPIEQARPDLVDLPLAADETVDLPPLTEANLTLGRLSEALRSLGADDVAGTLPAVFDALDNPPGEDATWFTDVDRGVEAFRSFFDAAQQALPQLPANRGERWWLLTLGDELGYQARRAGYPSLDREDLAERARYTAMSEEELRAERGRIDDDNDFYDLLAEMLERRGLDEFGNPEAGTARGLQDVTRFDPSMAGALVRANGYQGVIVVGTLIERPAIGWVVDGHVEGTGQAPGGQPRRTQVWLRDSRYGPPHVQVLQTAGEREQAGRQASESQAAPADRQVSPAPEPATAGPPSDGRQAAERSTRNDEHDQDPARASEPEPITSPDEQALSAEAASRPGKDAAPKPSARAPSRTPRPASRRGARASDTDIHAGLSLMDGWRLARFIGVLSDEEELARWSAKPAGWGRGSAPDGLPFGLAFVEKRGLRFEGRAGDGGQHVVRVPYTDLANWLQAGTTGHLQRILVEADALRSRFRQAADGFQLLGQSHLCAAAVGELAQMSDDAAAAILDTALRVHQGQDIDAGVAGDIEWESAAVARLDELATVLPDPAATVSTPAAEVAIGEAVQAPGDPHVAMVVAQEPQRYDGDDGDYGVVYLTGFIVGHRLNNIVRWTYRDDETPQARRVPIPASLEGLIDTGSVIADHLLSPAEHEALEPSAGGFAPAQWLAVQPGGLTIAPPSEKAQLLPDETPRLPVTARRLASAAWHTFEKRGFGAADMVQAMNQDPGTGRFYLREPSDAAARHVHDGLRRLPSDGLLMGPQDGRPPQEWVSVPWPQVLGWISRGVTPERRQVLLEARAARERFAHDSTRAGFTVLGEDSLWRSAYEELDRIYERALALIYDPAIRGAGHEPDDDVGARELTRIAELVATLPGLMATDDVYGRPVPPSQINDGDIVLYDRTPVRLTAPPQRRDSPIRHVRLSGQVHRSDGTTEAIRWAVPDNGGGDRISVISVPRSLAGLVEPPAPGPAPAQQETLFGGEHAGARSEPVEQEARESAASRETDRAEPDPVTSPPGEPAHSEETDLSGLDDVTGRNEGEQEQGQGEVDAAAAAAAIRAAADQEDEIDGLFSVDEVPQAPHRRNSRGVGSGFLWGSPREQGENGRDEQLRGQSRTPLDSVPSPGVQPDSPDGQDEVLHRDGGESGEPDRGSDAGAGRGGSAGRDLPGEGGPGEYGPAEGGGDRPARGGAGRAGAGDRGGPGGDTGGQQPGTGGMDADGDRAGPPAVRGDSRRAAGVEPDPAADGRDEPQAPAAPPESAAEAEPAPRFRPSSQDDLAPAGAVGRVRANIEALRTLRAIQADSRPATKAEQAALARWSGWGAVPQVFDERETVDDQPGPGVRFARERAELKELLSEKEYDAARRNTLNAHYTDAAIVKAIWDNVASHVPRLPQGPVRLLDPGCGSGNFIGLAPPGMQIVGVEVEPVTAGIAAALYPDAQILNESFARTRVPRGSFDLVVGNVPFGNFPMTDRLHNPNDRNIHDAFILKSLALTRPGGLVAVISSRYTMDAVNPAVRREMAALGDLVGAVRLPDNAHQRAAGTKVVTDILVFRPRAADQEPSGPDWEQTRPVQVDGTDVMVNQYWLDHPEQVLGDFTLGGAYRRDELTVKHNGDLHAALAEAIGRVVDQAAEAGLTIGEATSAQPDRGPAMVVAADDRRPEGYLASHPDKRTDFTRVNAFGVAEAYEPPTSQRPELEHLLRVRDAAVDLLQAEAASLDDTPEIDELRSLLNIVYDAYANRYGPLNRFTQRRTGRTDKETGAELFARIRPPQGGFRTDPYAPVVYALENFDSADQRATKAEIFTQRVIAPRTPPLGADTPDEALAICLDVHGEVRLDYIARLLGCPSEEARDRLGTLVFEDPAHRDRLIPATEYLSGPVREKLTAAREAAIDDPRFDGHVQALTAVIPPDLRPEEIRARLGAVWIDAKYVQEFLQEILEDRSLKVHHGGGTYWDVIGNNHGVLATSTWGTDRFPAPKLVKTILEQRPPQVYDNRGTSREPVYVLNADATAAAGEKAEEILERFGEWAWEDPQRTTELARVYNEKFNGLVLRSYDGAKLSLPGLAIDFKPHPHQYAAVARMINEPGALLAHEVGAGKTAEQVIGVMELRRLGLVNKPAIVVPNHMLEQFSREFLQLYPQARLLVANKEDLRADRRRAFVSRCATGNWDAVIIAHSSFEKIPMSRDAQEAYLTKELERFETAIENASAFGDDSRLVKRLESAKVRAEERILRKIDSIKDPGITFEATGLDYLVVDELHLFKNLRTPSSIPGAGIDGSNRATDLDMKIQFLRERNGSRVVTGATATPIANSVTEAYVMQRYLRPDLLGDAGLEDFDAWAATFGETRVEIEFSPDGNGFRQKARFAKFLNVPEMLRMWHVSADIKTAEDLDLKVPLLAEREDGRREAETVAIEPSDELLQLVAELGERAEAIRMKRVKPWEDNMLKVSSDGRKGALDLRMMGRDNDPDVPTKLDVAAGNIAAIWEENRDRTYLGPDGEPHPVPGSLQLVFSDLGTPGGKGETRWNAYDELRDLLVERGLPREAVRFIHEARNDREKGELFAACRSGRVAVLIGSTEKMGVGTNVQARAVALHHLDCPWRPADLQQREGRIIRQGNQNPEVRILRYVTERSFDAYTWQGVTRKARFIGQVMKGRLDIREMEDIGEQALSYNEVKALATGNPFLMDLAEAEATLTRLERRERAYRRNQNMLASTIESAETGITNEESRISALDAAIARRRDTTGEKFVMDLDGTRHTKRPAAGGALKNSIGHQLAVVTKGTHSRQHAVAGQLGGFPVATTVERHLGSYHITVALEGAPNGEIFLKPSDLQTIKSDALIIRMENRLARFEKAQEEAAGNIERYHVEIDRAHVALGEPFSEADELTAAQQRVAELKVKLDKMADPPENETAESPDRTTDAEVHDAGSDESAFTAVKALAAAQPRALPDQFKTAATNGGRADPGAQPYPLTPATAQGVQR